MAPSPSPPTALIPLDPTDPAALVAQSATETPPAERKYISHACEACRSRRSKCDGELPVCSACTRRRTICEYSEVDRRRGKLKKDEADALQEKVKSLESIIMVLSLGSDNDARGLLKTMRDKVPTPTPEGGLPVADVLAEWNVSRQKDVEYHPETLRLYTAGDLPVERVVLYGIRAYFKCSYTLFHIYEEHEMADILNRVYRPQEPIDNATLCEMCALTAIGSHYDADNFDPQVMENLYHTAGTYLNDCIEAHFLRGMRVVLCLSMFSFMTKRTSARHSLAMGLNIARHARVDEMPADVLVPYRKVYRSLLFMECWLSSSLGYPPGAVEGEFEFTQQPIIEPHPTIENDIQANLSAVGIMMAGIVQSVYKSSPVVFSLVDKHYEILRNWERNLPPRMKLEELKKETGNVFNEPHRRSLILVHVMFFGAQMLLQRRLLVTMAQERMTGRWNLDGSWEDGRVIEQQCIAAAEEVVYLLDVLGYTRHMFRRCWLCIGHAYAACSVLLFDVAQRLLYRQTSDIHLQIARIQECIYMLDGCVGADRVAKAMLEIVLPLHEQLRRLASEDQSTTHKSGIYDLLGNPQGEPAATNATTRADPQIRADVIPAMQTAIEVLGNPFGHPRRNNLDSFAPGDPSVPTWWN